MKKLFVFLAILLTTAGTVTYLQAAPAYASGCSESKSILGFTPWCDGVELDNIETEDGLKNSIFQIVANIASDITVAGTYLALMFVIYGGYKYMFSYGDPTKAATGKKTLTQAFIGLAIVLLANTIFNTVRAVIFVNGPMSNDVDATAMISNIISWTVAMGGVVAAIFLVYGGVSYMTSNGEPGKLAKAKNAIIYALIGLAIVALAEGITAAVTNVVLDSQKTSTNLELIIAKEDINR